MWTIFHLAHFVSVVLGFGIGLISGAKAFGVIGGVAGALVGGYLGLVVGRVPELWVLRSLARDVNDKTSDELREVLRSADCVAPNIVLLELKHRDEDIRGELPMVLDWLESEDRRTRSRGWAALASAFPELAQKLDDYPINGPTEECRRKVEILHRIVEPSH